ncbi:GNAT family N-acetyltransferase [Anaerocolumna aminovalerica]|uniref:Ribosomal protein S18 acetylase RimI n=1 Tax=Anaerocolumna aminovalerica TaxID=1527 RepID=A0A1I5G3U6_9FIRM|nr:GNAT family N-acetyltransferase [Anaerocolumna aminovalerica]MBU5331271.1 GNAT family N-acetyltransferase [Anaerocolumna aminovalerica]SFO30221.1 Ribosomal protein S18 acetylase RimI [Anaerocolumna aminovalerica]
MHLEKLHQLDKQQKIEVKKLVSKCLTADGLSRELYLDNDMNLYENLDSFFLLYDQKQLVSVLTIFQMNEREAEISGYTLPDKRKKGYFTALLNAAEEELLDFDIYDMVFVAEPNSTSGKMAALSLGASFIKSEYLLRLKLEDYTKKYSEFLSNLNFIVKPLTSKDIMQAAYIHSEIFKTEFQESEELIQNILESDCMVCYGAKLEEELIGICNVNYGKNKASIFGYGVIPRFQGKGYGKGLINYVLRQLIKDKVSEVTLQVSSNSKNAMKIYNYLGFQIVTQYDYYGCQIELEE